MKEVEIMEKVKEYLKEVERKKYEPMKDVDWEAVGKIDRPQREEYFDF